MANDGSVVFGVELDESGLKAGIQNLDKSINNWGKAIIGAKAFSVVTKALVDVAKAGISYNAQMEAYQTNFSVLLGDEAKALQHVANMREMAAKTPFGMADLASANQTLLSFGLSADEANKAMAQLGDISMGNAERLGSLSLAFAQVSSAGKLSGQDLLQMINAGFNPLSTIAEKTGANLADLKEVMAGGKGSKEFQRMVKAAQKEVKKMGDQASESSKWLAKIGEEGMISAEMVGMAMEAETAPGGRFYQGMDKASQTIGGMWSTLQDETSALIGNVFQPVSNALKDVVLPAAVGVVSTLNSLFDSDKDVAISVETQAAIDNVTSLDEDIQALKNKYAAETIKIRLDYENAQDLISQLEAAQQRLEGTPKKLWSQKDKELLQDLTSQLVGIYPELQKYVSNDGILKLEAEAVRELTTEYKNLAFEKAAQAHYQEMYDRVLDAEINNEVLKEQVEQLNQRRKEIEQTRDAWDDLAGGTFDSEKMFRRADEGTPVSTENLESYLGMLETFLELGGQFDQLGNQEGFDLTTLFGTDGSIKSAEEIAGSAEALESLRAVLEEINLVAIEQTGEQQSALSAIDAEILAASEAQLQAAANLEEAHSRLEAIKAVIEKAANPKGEGAGEGADGETPAKAAGADIVNEEAEGVEENTGVLKAAVQAATSASIEGADISDANSIGYNIAGGMAAGVASGAGLLSSAVKRIIQQALKAGKDFAKIASPSKLFRDELGVFLPMGAAAGVEREAWRLNAAVQNMVDSSIPNMSSVSSGIANRVVGSSPMAASLPQVFNQTNNFNLPVETPDEFAQTMRIYNTYGLAAQG